MIFEVLAVGLLLHGTVRSPRGVLQFLRYRGPLPLTTFVTMDGKQYSRYLSYLCLTEMTGLYSLRYGYYSYIFLTRLMQISMQHHLSC